jgi:hypothetical protein
MATIVEAVRLPLDYNLTIRGSRFVSSDDRGQSVISHGYPYEACDDER